MEQSPKEPNFSVEKQSTEKDAEKDKKKNKSKRVGFVLPKPESTSAVESSTETELSTFDKLLADIAFRRKTEKEIPETETAEKATPQTETAEKADADAVTVEKEKEDATPLESDETSKSESADDGAGPETEHFTNDYEKPIRAKELPSNKIGYGEGILDLGRDDELVLELRSQTPATETVEQPVQPEQPERQPVSDDQLTSAEQSSVPETEDSRQPEVDSGNSPRQVEAVAITPEAEPVQPRPVSAESSHDEATTEARPEQPRSEPVPATFFAETIPVNSAQHPDVQEQYERTVIDSVAPTNERPIAAEKAITRQQLEDEVYYATKAGQRRGLLAGAVAAGAYEHFKHRRREKKQEKVQKQQALQQRKDREKYEFDLAEQAKMLNQKQRQSPETVLPKPVTQTPEQPTVPKPVTPTFERPNVVAALRMSRENVRPQPRYESLRPTTSQQPETITRPSVIMQPERFRPEKQAYVVPFATKLEQLVPKERQIIQERENLGKLVPITNTEAVERLVIPREHRIETSAWHSIEVDAKTGKAVEKPNFVYGEEYYHERAQESAPRSNSQKQTAGEVALVAAALSDRSPNDTDGDAHYPANASQQKKDSPHGALLAKTRGSMRPKKQKQSASPLWPWLVALVVVVVLLIFAL